MIIKLHDGTTAFACTEEDMQAGGFGPLPSDPKAIYKKTPEETQFLAAMFQAYDDLRNLGWRESMYCPRDRSTVLLISAGTTGIFEGYRDEEGWFWCYDGDVVALRCDPVQGRRRKAEAMSEASVSKTDEITRQRLVRVCEETGAATVTAGAWIGYRLAMEDARRIVRKWLQDEASRGNLRWGDSSPMKRHDIMHEEAWLRLHVRLEEG